MSSVSRIHQALTEQIRSTQTLGAKSSSKEVEVFNGLLANQIKQTNALQHAADRETESFITGESENIHDVLIKAEEASIALDLTIQTRNKVVEAWQDLKNIAL